MDRDVSDSSAMSVHAEDDARIAAPQRHLAEFASGLNFPELPPDVVERAKLCIADTVAVVIAGVRVPWAAPLQALARADGEGPCTLITPLDGGAGEMGFTRARPAIAALVHGTAAHALEHDSLRQPSAGVHPGATLVPAVLALAEASGASGREAIAAFVAGNEVMSRLGAATRHSTESLGFHAPGVTGPIGAAVAAARLARLDAAAMGDAIGIACSLGGGLLAFGDSRRGAEVKRLHFGRAAEAGLLAASLARAGHAGPDTALAGARGFLAAYAREPAPELLDSGLGVAWETLRIAFKKYPCHISAHMPLEALLGLRDAGGFEAGDIVRIRVLGNEKMATRHDIRAPADIPQAQYSVPFAMALALHRDARDPAAWEAGALRDPAIAATLPRIELLERRDEPAAGWEACVEITLRDGRRLERHAADFEGMPQRPLDRDALGEKFMRCARSLGEARARALFERLMSLEHAPRVSLADGAPHA